MNIDAKFCEWLYLKRHPFVYKYGSKTGRTEEHKWYNLDDKTWNTMQDIYEYYIISSGPNLIKKMAEKLAKMPIN